MPCNPKFSLAVVVVAEGAEEVVAGGAAVEEVAAPARRVPVGAFLLPPELHGPPAQAPSQVPRPAQAVARRLPPAHDLPLRPLPAQKPGPGPQAQRQHKAPELERNRALPEPQPIAPRRAVHRRAK